MNNSKRTDDESGDESTGALPEEWVDTDRDPKLPSANLGTFEMNQGLCLYDRDHPGQYLIGPGVDVGRTQ